MSDSAKRLYEVCEVVVQITLLVLVLLYDDATIEDLYCCAPVLAVCSLFLGY